MISSLNDRLRRAEKLLVDPSPRAIEHAGFVLREALSLAKAWSDSTISTEDLADFKACCARVKTLLEGALRAQWAHVHRISAATSTYTAGPGTKRWSPRAWTLNLQG